MGRGLRWREKERGRGLIEGRRPPWRWSTSENIMGSTSSADNCSSLIRYGYRCGRCKLQNVKIVNRGIDWNNADNSYWRRDVKRFETMRVTLLGNAEFEAVDVVLEGDCVYEVPSGYKLLVTNENSAAAGEKSGRLQVGLPNGVASKSKDDDRHQRIQYVQIILPVVGFLFQVAYSSVLSPPGGVYQEGPLAGKAIMSNTICFRVYKFWNDLALYSCLAMLPMLITFISTSSHQVLISLLSSLIYKLVWACLAFTAAAYMSASWVISIPGQINQAMLVTVTMVACGILCSIFIGLLLIQMRIRFLCIPSTSEQTDQQEGSKQDVVISMSSVQQFNDKENGLNPTEARASDEEGCPA